MLPRHNLKTGEYEDFNPAGRCDWVQIAAMIAAAVISAYGAKTQADAQQKTMNYNAAVARQRADRERQEAQAREADFRKQQSRAEARRRALGGVSGVDQGEGSPLLTSEDFAGEVELAALRIRAGGDVAATRLEQSAGLSEFQGRAAQSAGNIRAGALLVGGASKAWRARSKSSSRAKSSSPSYKDSGYEAGGGYSDF